MQTGLIDRAAILTKLSDDSLVGFINYYNALTDQAKDDERSQADKNVPGFLVRLSH
jgi:hypothetical protein